jgi:hypothetical protein
VTVTEAVPEARPPWLSLTAHVAVYVLGLAKDWEMLWLDPDTAPDHE